MKSIGFFDWKLNSAHPVSTMKLVYQKKHKPSIPDMHNAIHLCIIISGWQQGVFASSRIMSNQGDIYITAPWEPHSIITCSDNRELLLINIDSDALRSFFFTGQEQLDFLLCMPPAERMLHINTLLQSSNAVRRIIENFTVDDSPQKLLQLWNCVLNLFITVLPEKTEHLPLPGNYRKLLPALEKLSNRLMTLPEAAELCNLSQSYFAVLFRKQFALSFSRYERNFRLNGAAAAIRRGVTLKEAADMWGFCDKSHLARLLKIYN